MLERQHLRPQPHHAQGFTLVEMMVTIAVLIISLGIALPSMNDWLRNSRVNATSDALQSGIRSAHRDAIRHSRMVMLVLSPAAPGASPSPATNGQAKSFWATYTVPLNGSGENPMLIQSGTFQDIDNAANIAGPTAICFNSLGRISAATLPTAQCALPNGQAFYTFAIDNTQAQRQPQVTVSLTGEVKSCDRSRGTSHPAACPPASISEPQQPSEDE